MENKEKSFIEMKKERREEIGARINALRITKKMTLDDFVEFLDKEISKATLSRICNGKQLPSETFLYLLRSKTGISYDYILFGEERPVEKAPLKKLCGIISDSKRGTFDEFVILCKNATNSYQKLYSDELEYENKHNFKFFKAMFGLDVESIAKKLAKSENVIYKQSIFPYSNSMSFVLDFCGNFNISADFFIDEEFTNIPAEISHYLYGFTYSDQLELLKTFSNIAKDLNLI